MSQLCLDHVPDTILSTLEAIILRWHIRADRQLSNEEALSTKVNFPILQGEFSGFFSV